MAVALIRMKTPEYCTNCGSDDIAFLHYAFAFLLFVCMAFVAWACSEETLVQLDKPTRDRFRNAYFTLAALMIVAPVATVAMTYILGFYDRRVFFVELGGIWTFSAYWLLKSYELSLSKAERMAVMGQMSTTDQVPATQASLRIKASRLLDYRLTRQYDIVPNTNAGLKSSTRTFSHNKDRQPESSWDKQ